MTLKRFAILAQRAYSDKPDYGDESASGRAVVYGSTVAFPGTNNPACVLADMDVETVYIDGFGLLHRGFWEAYNPLRWDLLKLSPEAITAHSEGAALAILYAADLCLAGKPPQALYGFEPPRCSADGAIAALLSVNKVQCYLTRHSFDAVPLVPYLFHPWQHPAPLIQIGEPADPNPDPEWCIAENIVQRFAPHMIEAVIAVLPS